MNDKIFNISSKVLMIIVIVVGSILSSIIMSYGDPHKYDEEDIYRMGKEVAIKEGKNKEYSQAELDAFINETGTKMKQELSEKQDSNVFNVLVFTLWIVGITTGLVLIGAIFGIALEPKKYLVGIAGIIVLVLLVYIIYSTSSEEIPANLQAHNENLISDGKEAFYDSASMKIAGGAITSALVLMAIGVLTIIGSSIYKMVKA